MRIISQDGSIDIPYSGAAVEHQKKLDPDIYEILVATTRNWYHFAEYSSEAKAIRAMEMLQNEYSRHYFETGGEMATRDLYIPPFGFIPPKVFQFPKDEDVEVE